MHIHNTVNRLTKQHENHNYLSLGIGHLLSVTS